MEEVVVVGGNDCGFYHVHQRCIETWSSSRASFVYGWLCRPSSALPLHVWLHSDSESPNTNNGFVNQPTPVRVPPHPRPPPPSSPVIPRQTSLPPSTQTSIPFHQGPHPCPQLQQSTALRSESRLFTVCLVCPVSGWPMADKTPASLSQPSAFPQTFCCSCLPFPSLPFPTAPDVPLW